MGTLQLGHYIFARLPNSKSDSKIHFWNPFQKDAAIFAHHSSKRTTVYTGKFYLILIALIAWLAGYMKL